jgi:hypothetical protein
VSVGDTLAVARMTLTGGKFNPATALTGLAVRLVK